MSSTRFAPVIGITVSKYASAAGIVHAVEDALMGVTEREIDYPTGERGGLIYVIQSLTYAVGTYQSPWSKTYPTAAQAIELCMANAPVEIRVAGVPS